ncbi:MAG: hypothetical protein RSF30_04375 [Lachnospiraceae bacterium]
MACERKARKRHNTIAFWLSDEERSWVDAKIILSGLPKGEYYRNAVLGQEVTVVAGKYMSERVGKVLEQIAEELKRGNTEKEALLEEILAELLQIWKNENALAGNKDISQ